jgi:hypothetical protein
MRIRVAQPSGEIIVSHEGDPPVTYPVKDGYVEVGDLDAARFLAVVPTAWIETAPAAKTGTPGGPTETAARAGTA